MTPRMKKRYTQPQISSYRIICCCAKAFPLFLEQVKKTKIESGENLTGSNNIEYAS